MILIGKWLLSPIDIDEVKRKGIDIIQSGAFPPKLKYVFMDIAEIFGAIIELMKYVRG